MSDQKDLKETINKILFDISEIQLCLEDTKTKPDKPSNSRKCECCGNLLDNEGKVIPVF